MAQYPAFIDLSSLDGTSGFAIPGVAAVDYAGASVSSAGDIVVHAFDAGHNRTQVDLYVDNNASADAAIWLTGDHHGLTAADFIL